VSHVAPPALGLLTGAHDMAPLAAKLRREGVFSRVDDSTASIGKRYARNDELGTPFGITVDFACEFYFTVFTYCT